MASSGQLPWPWGHGARRLARSEVGSSGEGEGLGQGLTLPCHPVGEWWGLSPPGSPGCGASRHTGSPLVHVDLCDLCVWMDRWSRWVSSTQWGDGLAQDWCVLSWEMAPRFRLFFLPLPVGLSCCGPHGPFSESPGACWDLWMSDPPPFRWTLLWMPSHLLLEPGAPCSLRIKALACAGWGPGCTRRLP